MLNIEKILEPVKLIVLEAMQMSIVILFVTNSQEASELFLMQKTIVGRSSKADFVLNDEKMSGRHCSFEITKDEKVQFKDLDSTNGSFLNGVKVMHHLLKLGDKIMMGNTTCYIDQDRLSQKERLTIGRSTGNEKISGELALPTVPRSDNNSVSIVKLKKDKIKDASKYNRDVKVNDKDRFIEQEESSGKTRMLKLDKNLLNKKKK